MSLINDLTHRWKDIDRPFLIYSDEKLFFDDIANLDGLNLEGVRCGDVVALIGDFNSITILTLLQLIDKKTIIVPLTKDTKEQHDYFFESANVDVVIEDNKVRRLNHDAKHNLIDHLREQEHPGLVLFSTGTTGRPKAILHDMTHFLKRFETPRPTLKTINFLLFDHIGGLNTLLHTLFNKGTVIAPSTRNVEHILELCAKHEIEVLPTTPTFLRMMLMSGLIPEKMPESLKIITYGTERMDQPTLDALCKILPNIDFRQTFGMSELGIVRVKSKSRDSLFMKIGGEGVKTRVVDDVLEICSETRMLGYLNAESPFDDEGWYNTKDLVEERDGFYKITGRTSEVINVGGLKFMASEVERVALDYEGIEFVKASAKKNPITGQHVELKVQTLPNNNIDLADYKRFLKDRLQRHMVPTRIRVGDISVGHRFKKA